MSEKTQGGTLDRGLTPEEQRLKDKYAHLSGIFARWLDLPEPDFGVPAGRYVLVDDIEAAAETWNSDDIRFLAVCMRWIRALDE